MLKACMSESSTETNVNSPDASWGLLCMCCDKQAPTEICMEVVPTASWGTCGNERKKKPARACNVKYTRQAFLHQFAQCVFLRLGHCVGLQAPLQFLATNIRNSSKKQSKKSQNSWYVEAWGHFLLHLGCRERSWDDFVHPISFQFSNKKKDPTLMNFGNRFGVEFVKTDVGKSFCLLTRLGRCFCPFLEAQMWLKCCK